eukprot:3933705-Rhodomonas_salina.1
MGAVQASVRLGVPGPTSDSEPASASEARGTSIMATMLPTTSTRLVWRGLVTVTVTVANLKCVTPTVTLLLTAYRSDGSL